MATMDHTPYGRGYMKGLHYYHHENDYWDSHVPTGSANTTNPLRPILDDLWQTNLLGGGHGQGPAWGFNNTCARLQKKDPAVAVGAGECPVFGGCTLLGEHSDRASGGYEEAVLAREVLRSLAEYEPAAAAPYYLFWAPHIAHVPLQIPRAYYDKWADFVAQSGGDRPNHARQIYTAMTSFADEMIGSLAAKLQEKRMWGNTLFILTSDNGGPLFGSGDAGGNNFPLTGGKGSQWDGGIRVPAFVSGGFLPVAVRGTKYTGLVAAWDWYGTMCELAGVDPTDWRAAAATAAPGRAGVALPPIDSHSLLPVLLPGLAPPNRAKTKVNTRRRALPITTDMSTPLPTSLGLVFTAVQGVIVEEEELQEAQPDEERSGEVSPTVVRQLWKLVVGNLSQSARTGPLFPNRTSDTCCFGSGGFGGACTPVGPSDPCYKTGGRTECGGE